MKCRHCGHPLDLPFVDLATSPPSNAYLTREQLNAPERWYPLRVLVCTACWLVQTEDFAEADQLFDEDYAYFSSFSSSWLAHAEGYVTTIAERFGLGSASEVVEIAANDGYLLQYFRARGIPCLGIEPTASTAAAARDKGIPIVQEFFGRALATRLREEGHAADLMVGNNVLAHVPDINDFVGGFTILLKDEGVVTFEFPHLQNLVEQCQFDTIYHEHYSYLSLTAVDAVFRTNGLHVFDVVEIPTHGGSLRVFGQRAETGARERTAAVSALLAREERIGVTTPAWYGALQGECLRIKYDLLEFLLQARREGKRVAAYGAAAKGVTLINWAGLRSDLLAWAVDRNPAKQGKFLPGSQIPIVDVDRIREERPDYLLILPWNLKSEIMEQVSWIREWGGCFLTAIPRLEVLE